MPVYVDGFVMPVPLDKITEYRKLARTAARIWREHGALDYRECVGEDLKNEWGVAFPQLAGAGEGETVVFSWITYKSRKHRDKVNAKAIADPRLKCNASAMPFDCKRMAYGGFKTLVHL